MSSNTDSQRGGGALRYIIEDPLRPNGERALASALLDLLMQRQALHARQFRIGDDIALSFAQLKMLFHLSSDEPLTLSQFAASAALTPASATQALTALENTGFVTRSRDTSDKRAVSIVLTPLGVAVRDQARREFIAQWDAAMSAIDDDAANAAAAIMHQLVAVMTPPNAS